MDGHWRYEDIERGEPEHRRTKIEELSRAIKLDVIESTSEPLGQDAFGQVRNASLKVKGSKGQF